MWSAIPRAYVVSVSLTVAVSGREMFILLGLALGEVDFGHLLRLFAVEHGRAMKIAFCTPARRLLLSVHR